MNWRIGIPTLDRPLFGMGRVAVLTDKGRVEVCYRSQWPDYIAVDVAAFERARRAA